MAKGAFIYDAETREFRRRGHQAEWGRRPSAETPDGAAAASEAFPDAPGSGDSAQVDKPDGYLDPTPVRRRRKSARRNAGRGMSSAWKGIMWILILLMGLVWVYMLYVQSQNISHGPENEKFFHFEREEVVPGR